MPTHNHPTLSQRALDAVRTLIGAGATAPHPFSRRERLTQFLIALTVPGCILIAIAWLISVASMLILGRDNPLRGIALTSVVVIAITMIVPGALIRSPITTIFVGITVVLGLLRFYDITLINERAHNGIALLVLGLALIYVSKLHEEQTNAQEQPHSRRFFLLFISGIVCIAVGILAIIYYDQEPNWFVAFIHTLASMHTLLMLVAIYSIPSQSAGKV